MKILLLTHPYAGAENFGKSMADDLGYKFINDPLEPKPTSFPVIEGHFDENNDAIASFTSSYSIPHEYTYPNDVDDNTIIKHNVKWEKKALAMTEDNFLSAWVSKFDKVIGMYSEDSESVWKSYLSHVNNIKQINNYHFHQWSKREFIPYDDSHWDVEEKSKIMASWNYIKDYITNNSLDYVTKEQIYETIDRVEFNSILDTLNCNLPHVTTSSAEDTSTYIHTLGKELPHRW